MSINEQRLTANELELKKEVSELVKHLNEKLFQLKQTGINTSVNSKAFNDGREDFYVGAYVTFSLSI